MSLQRLPGRFRPQIAFLLTAALLIQSFLPSVAQAQEETVARDSSLDSRNTPELLDYYPPSDLARVTDSFVAVPTSDERPATSDPLVILIQDLHCHPGVQRKISGLLAHYDSLGIAQDSVFVEGASGLVDTTRVALFPDERIKREVTEEFVDSGLFTGMEEYAILNQKTHYLYGVEDGKTYDLHKDFFRQSFEGRNELAQKIRFLQNRLATLEPQVLNRTQQKLKAQQKDYSSGKLSLARYLKSLERQSSEIPAELRSMQSLLRLEAHLSKPERLKSDTQDFLTLLYPRLTKEESDRLSQYAKANTEVYYLYLFQLANRYGALSGASPALRDYLTYNHRKEHQDLPQFQRKLEEAEHQLLLAEAKDQNSKNLVQAEWDLKLLSDLLELKLTEDQLKEILPRTNNLLAVLESLLSHEPTSPRANETSSLKELIAEAIDFYAIALMRDQPLIETTLKKQGENPGILVAGGFHTQGIAAILKERGISYLVLSPNVESYGEKDQERYIDVLLGKTPKDLGVPAEQQALSPGVGIHLNEGLALMNWRKTHPKPLEVQEKRSELSGTLGKREKVARLTPIPAVFAALLTLTMVTVVSVFGGADGFLASTAMTPFDDLWNVDPKSKSGTEGLLARVKKSKAWKRLEGIGGMFPSSFHVAGDESGTFFNRQRHVHREMEAAKRYAKSLQKPEIDLVRLQLVATLHEMGRLPFAGFVEGAAEEFFPEVPGIMTSVPGGSGHEKRFNRVLTQRLVYESSDLYVPLDLAADVEMGLSESWSTDMSPEARIVFLADKMTGYVEDFVLAYKLRYKDQRIVEDFEGRSEFLKRVFGTDDLSEIDALSMEDFDEFVIEKSLALMRRVVDPLSLTVVEGSLETLDQHRDRFEKKLFPRLLDVVKTKTVIHPLFEEGLEKLRKTPKGKENALSFCLTMTEAVMTHVAHRPIPSLTLVWTEPPHISGWNRLKQAFQRSASVLLMGTVLLLVATGCSSLATKKGNAEGLRPPFGGKAPTVLKEEAKAPAPPAVVVVQQDFGKTNAVVKIDQAPTVKAPEPMNPLSPILPTLEDEKTQLEKDFPKADLTSVWEDDGWKAQNEAQQRKTLDQLRDLVQERDLLHPFEGPVAFHFDDLKERMDQAKEPKVTELPVQVEKKPGVPSDRAALETAKTNLANSFPKLDLGKLFSQIDRTTNANGGTIVDDKMREEWVREYFTNFTVRAMIKNVSNQDFTLKKPPELGPRSVTFQGRFRGRLLFSVKMNRGTHPGLADLWSRIAIFSDEQGSELYEHTQQAQRDRELGKEHKAGDLDDISKGIYEVYAALYLFGPDNENQFEIQFNGLKPGQVPDYFSEQQAKKFLKDLTGLDPVSDKPWPLVPAPPPVVESEVVSAPIPPKTPPWLPWLYIIGVPVVVIGGIAFVVYRKSRGGGGTGLILITCGLLAGDTRVAQALGRPDGKPPVGPDPLSVSALTPLYVPEVLPQRDPWDPLNKASLLLKQNKGAQRRSFMDMRQQQLQKVLAVQS